MENLNKIKLLKEHSEEIKKNSNLPPL